MKFTVRRALPTDADGILHAHRASILEVALRDYSPTEVRAWSDPLRAEGYVSAMQEGGETMFVAESARDGIVGFSSIEGSVVRAVYVAPAAIGTGAGRALYLALEAIARSQGVRELSLSGSVTARRFYERMGFRVVEEISHRLSAGIEIRGYRMSKSLESGDTEGQEWMMGRETTLRGGCYCGAIRYEALGPFGTTSHCHCEDCRRSHSSAFVTWSSTDRNRFRITQCREALSLYESHPGVRWGFCRNCGASLYYENESELECAYFTLASLDDDTSSPEPSRHFSFEERVAWFSPGDALPKHHAKSDDPII